MASTLQRALKQVEREISNFDRQIEHARAQIPAAKAEAQQIVDEARDTALKVMQEAQVAVKAKHTEADAALIAATSMLSETKATLDKAANKAAQEAVAKLQAETAEALSLIEAFKPLLSEVSKLERRRDDLLASVGELEERYRDTKDLNDKMQRQVDAMRKRFESAA